MEVNYTHDDAVRNLCIAGDEDIPLPERLEARERVAAYIERLEAERDHYERVAQEHVNAAVERDQLTDRLNTVAYYINQAQEAVRHE